MFQHPFSFSGRIRRTEYGLSILMFLPGNNRFEPNLREQNPRPPAQRIKQAGDLPRKSAQRHVLYPGDPGTGPGDGKDRKAIMNLSI